MAAIAHHRSGSILIYYNPMLKIVTALLLMASLSPSWAENKNKTVWFSGRKDNDLVLALKAAGAKLHGKQTPSEAVEAAPRSSVVLLLADGYPVSRVALNAGIWQKAQEKDLRLYVEFPEWLPDQTMGPTLTTKWERIVVSSDDFGAKLANLRILVAHDCHYLQVAAKDPLLVVAKVAGFDRAVFGLPKEAAPILFRWPGTKTFVATSKLSGFASARFAPVQEWETAWNHLLRELGLELSIRYQPTVEPSYSKEEALPRNWQQTTLKRATEWYEKSGLLTSEERWRSLEKNLRAGMEIAPEAGAIDQGGDGTFGILEGYSSEVTYRGDQRQRLPIRADCQAESAMVYAAEYLLSENRKHRKRAQNLLNYLYQTSDMHAGVRGNPEHPAFGLISWGAVAPLWTIANYGDDNARTMLATMFVAGSLKSDRWDEPLLKALVANLRTTGKLGFRGDRVDNGPLEQNGWKHYEQAETINYSPHFEAYSWACFLWAYQHTQHAPFLEKTKTAIRMTMKAYPDKWRWNDNMERAHMLLALAWLVRLENTEEHRQWLRTVCYDLLKVQDASGALQERFRNGGGHYQMPTSNEAYGTTETPLLQENGDPVSDQLYVSGFALLGFHEAAAVLADEKIEKGADKLAEYLCRIQTRSEKHPYLDGSWFRAFDYNRWEPWGSSGDVGWGAWCVETGWAQAWGAAILGLREKRTTLWDLTADSQIAKYWPRVQELMARNSGGPWKPGP